MDKTNNPVLDNMYKECYKDFEAYIYCNNKQVENKADRSMTSFASICAFIKQNIHDEEIANKLNLLIRQLIISYSKENKYVTELFYKYGIIQGFENYEKLKKEL